MNLHQVLADANDAVWNNQPTIKVVKDLRAVVAQLAQENAELRYATPDR